MLAFFLVYFISLLTYLLCSGIMIALQISGLITFKIAIIGHIIVATLIVIVVIFFIERSKRSLGSKVLKFKSIPVVIRIILTCSSIVLLLADYKFNRPAINFLPWTAGLIIFFLYLIWFSGRYIMDKGLVYDGTVLRWEDIDSLKWKQGSSATTKLFIRRRDKGIYNKLRISIYNGQKLAVDRILNQKVM